MLALLAMVQFVLVVVWSRRRTKRSSNGVWIGLLVSTSLLLINTMVVTSRERIVRICHDLAGMVDDGDILGIGNHLATVFVAENLDKREFLDRVRSTLTRFSVDEPYLYGFELSFPSTDVGVVEFGSLARIRQQDAVLDNLVIRWRLTCCTEEGVWKVTQVEVVPSPQSPIRSLRFE